MRILAVESSAVAASAALMEDGHLLGECFLNTKLTHSQTLMPMIDQLLKNTRTAPDSVDLFAVSAGPGSFTGVRIGVASVKGLAMALGKPCAGVSTLEALAYQAAYADGVVCAAMDARCKQAYAALFEVGSGAVRRLTDDEALPLEELAGKLENLEKVIYLVGDGANLCYNEAGIRRTGARLLPDALRYQHAWGVALAAEQMAERGQTCGADALMPFYLRVPQAERELKKRQADRERKAGNEICEL